MIINVIWTFVVRIVLLAECVTPVEKKTDWNSHQTYPPTQSLSEHIAGVRTIGCGRSGHGG